MSPPVAHLVDEILEEIFLRLPTTEALARASTASPHFHRIITDRPFLRLYRKRHPPPLLGFVDKDGFHPAQAPHPSTPLARALADAANFTYSFVPNPSKRRWRPRGVCDGRVLLDDGSSSAMFRNLAICDPLSLRYTLLPPIPLDQERSLSEIKPILVPIGEEEDETSFKVICVADFETKLVAFVFSSLAPKWSLATSTSWTSLGSRPLIWRCVGAHPYVERFFSRFDYVHGCFYSSSIWRDKLLVLDTHKMEFSTVNYILDNGMRSGIVLVGREGAIEMFSLVCNDSPNGSFDIYHTTQKNNCESSKEWQVENIIPLPSKYDYFTLGADEGFLFLGATAKDLDFFDYEDPSRMNEWEHEWDVDYFSLDSKTSELVEVCSRRAEFLNKDVYWFSGFPPSLSKPSI